jgi:polyphenol oxidase
VTVSPGRLADSLRRVELCEGVGAFFTGRHGGHSSVPYGELNLSLLVGEDPEVVRANRVQVLDAIGAIAPGPVRLAAMRQVHGAEVAHAANPDGRVESRAAEPEVAEPEADAIFSNSNDVALVVLAADCVPVLIADPVARLVGAAHAGRPGLAAGVVPALVAAMTKAGADPARMHAVVGPSICGACYEVPAQLREEVSAVAPAAWCVTRKGTPGLDLRAGLHAQLASAGVGTGAGPGRVTDDARCTAESAELYSYRRDGKTGRFAGLIWLAS